MFYLPANTIYHITTFKTFRVRVQSSPACYRYFSFFSFILVYHHLHCEFSHCLPIIYCSLWIPSQYNLNLLANSQSSSESSKHYVENSSYDSLEFILLNWYRVSFSNRMKINFTDNDSATVNILAKTLH